MLITPTIKENPTEMRDGKNQFCISCCKIMSHITLKQASSFFIHFFWMIHTVLNSLGFSTW